MAHQYHDGQRELQERFDTRRLADRGSQYTSNDYLDFCQTHQVRPSVGRVATCFDNALFESFNGLYKWELIYPQAPWRGLDDVEFATMTYVDWFNHRRLHGQITTDATYTTPAEAEAAYYRQDHPALEPVAQ